MLMCHSFLPTKLLHCHHFFSATCADAPDISNGGVIPGSMTGNSVGETAMYECDSMFEIVGSATVTCTLDPVDGNTAMFFPIPSCVGKYVLEYMHRE